MKTKKTKKTTDTYLAIQPSLHCSTPSKTYPGNYKKPTRNYFRRMYQISADLKTSTMKSSICYLSTGDQSPIKSRKTIKSTFFQAYSVTKTSTFGKQLQSTLPPHCKMSSNYSEKSLQRKTCERSPDINGMKPNTIRPLRQLEIF